MQTSKRVEGDVLLRLGSFISPVCICQREVAFVGVGLWGEIRVGVGADDP